MPTQRWVGVVVVCVGVIHRGEWVRVVVGWIIPAASLLGTLLFAYFAEVRLRSKVTSTAGSCLLATELKRHNSKTIFSLLADKRPGHSLPTPTG